MSEKQFVRYWRTGVSITVAVVATVAALLLAIIGTARSIRTHAQRALDLANEIVVNTRPIWDLEQTNVVATELRERALLIQRHAADVADALETPPRVTSDTVTT